MRALGRSLVLALLGSALCAGAASAQSVKQLGSFHDWAAYSAASGSGQICFAVAKPNDVTPRPDGYTQAYLYLTNRPDEQISNELNLIAGFALAADQPATLSIGNQHYDLFTKDDSAWLKDPTQNNALAGVIRAGSNLEIALTSAKGDKVKETFSLAGATAAAKAVAGGC